LNESAKTLKQPDSRRFRDYLILNDDYGVVITRRLHDIGGVWCSNYP